MGSQRGFVMVYLIITWSIVVFLAGSSVEGHGNNEHYFHVGCYNEDTVARALPIRLANYRQGGLSNIEKVRKCANTAGTQGYQAFGVQKNGECWSGINATFSYAKYGKDSSCTNGVGAAKANDVYILSFKVSHLGCFNEDPADRAMPVLVANKSTSYSNLIQSCARAAWKRGFTKVFGLQNGGECWSGNNASVTYDKHGAVTEECESSGGQRKIVVFRIDMSVPTTLVPQVTVTLAEITPKTEERIQSGYHSYGCFKKENEGSFSSPELLLGRVPKVKNSRAEIQRCANAARKLSFKAFGLQEHAECYGWRSVTALVHFLEPANNCRYGIGKKNSYFIYIFNRFMKTTSTPTPPRTGTRATMHDPKTNRTAAPPATLRKTTPPKPTSRRSTVFRRKITTLRPTTHRAIKTQPTSQKPTQRTAAAPTSQKSTVYMRRTTTMQTTTHWAVKTQITPRKPTSRKSTVYIRKSTTLRPTTHLETKSRPTSRKPTQWTTADSTSRRVMRRGTTLHPPTPRTMKTGITPRKTTLQTTPAHKKNVISNEINYRHIGCFGDSEDRALPVHLFLNYFPNSRNSIEKCAKASWSGRYEVFGVQHNGRECWSGINASLTYDKYGVSNGCSNGIGGAWANDVYAFVYYFTSLISFKPKGKKPNKNNQDPCELCGQIADYLASKDSPREYKHNLTCRNWEDKGNRICLECVIYGKKKDRGEDFNSYYRNMVEILTKGAKENKIEGLKMGWKSIMVKDTGMCISETTGKQNIKGLFNWGLTRIGYSATVACPLGPNESNATRRCVGDFNTGAVWGTPDDDSCNFKSKKTEAMNKLSKKKLDSRNAKEAATNFTKQFKSGSAKDMSEADANIAVDMVDNILSVEESLNQTADMVVEIIDTMMEMNTSNLKANASSRIIKALDTVAENIPLEKGTSKVLNSTNLVLQASAVDASTFKGLGFGINKNKGGGQSVVTSDDQSNLFVKLPRAVVENSNKSIPTRIGCIYFANNKLFTEEDEDDESGNERKPSDEVLSSSVYNTNTSHLSENVTLSFPRPEGRGMQNSSCVYWNEEVRRWSNKGCFPCDSNGGNEASVKCCCNHLTSFAVLFSPEDEPLASQDKKHARILSIISYVGCGISLAGVVLTFLTYSLFRHLRKTNQQPILMSLCVAIASLLIVFAVGIDSTSYRIGCQIVAVLLHYFTLATVLWMGVEAYNLYLQLVKVMAIYHRKFMLKASLFAWGVPALVVTATVVAAVIEYNTNGSSDRVFYYGNDQVCILHNYTYRMVSWFVPILVTILFNLVIFILVIYKLNCTGAMVTVDTKSNQKKRCWTALAIMSLLGLTWLFGALAISGARLAFEYLFCIFNSLQGFFIFFFHCIRIKEVRNQWSFFVSGLGFSHKESETSHQRSRGIGESHHSSDAPYVKVRNWIRRKESNSDQPKRKITVTTDVDDKNVHGSVCDENKVDIELDEVRDIDPHENDALENSGHSKRRDSHSSKSSSNP